MSTQKLTIELPSATCHFLRELIDSGEYANESEIILEALVPLAFEPAPEPGEPEHERWLKEEVLPALAEMDANPEACHTAEEVAESLGLKRHQRSMPNMPLPEAV